MCWDGAQGKSFEEVRDELREIATNSNRTAEDIGIDILGFMFGMSNDEIREVIAKMKDTSEVKEILNNIEKCQNEEI